MQDIITREIMVKANKERVYQALTSPEHIVKWFPDIVEGGTLEVGQRPVFVFTKQNHKAQIYVEDAKPHTYFAYRWVPGGEGFTGDVLTVPNTLVEFFIEEQSDGTKVTVKESGFSSLPAEVAEKQFRENSGGWEFMIGRLQNVMNQE
jgi:uncharacterized protein YndB with AHSA1/START domain